MLGSSLSIAIAIEHRTQFDGTNRYQSDYNHDLIY